MTYRERIIDAIAGKGGGSLPFIPRLDLWYKANSLAGTLPPEYKNASLMDIVDGLGVGYHCLLPDFSDFEYADADADIGLGVYHLGVNCYETVFHNVERIVVRDDKGGLRTTYKTPRGDIATEAVWDEDMRKNGITLWVVREHAIKGEKDWEAIAYIFENAEIVPRHDRLERFQNFVGDRAEAVAYAHTQAGAMHLLVKDLMPFDEFCYAFMDDEEALAQLAARIEPYMDRLYDAVVKAPSRLVFSGGNYDSVVTFPPMFERHMVPQIKKRAEQAHAMGKYLICHTDGENDGLMDLLVRCGFDVADSVCPAPMTRLSLAEYRRCFDGKTAIWGGIPSISVLGDSMSDGEFEKYFDSLLEQSGDGRRLILSIADTTPPRAKFERIKHIARLAGQFKVR